MGTVGLGYGRFGGEDRKWVRDGLARVRVSWHKGQGMISRGYETTGQEYAKVTHVIAVFKPTFDFFLHKTLISLNGMLKQFTHICD